MTSIAHVAPKSDTQKTNVQKVADAVALWDRQIAWGTKAGKPLSRRVIEHAGCAFLFEFADGDEDVYGCYDMAKLGPLDPLPHQPDHWLTVRGGLVTQCNCEDSQCRKRLCVHQVWLALMGGFSVRVPTIPLPAGVVVPCSRLGPAPRRQGSARNTPAMQGRVM